MIRPLSAATFTFFTVALLATGGAAMGQIAPEPEQIEEMLKGPAEGPVVMVNLLRFKKEADAPDEGLTGEEAYGRYGAQMVRWVTSQGARLIWSGRVDSMVIGDTDEYFHTIALMEYPSRSRVPAHRRRSPRRRVRGPPHRGARHAVADRHDDDRRTRPEPRWTRDRTTR